MRGRGTLWRRSPALASGRADLSCWGLSVGPCLPAPLLLLKPPLKLLCLSASSPYCLSLFMSLSISLCVCFSVSLSCYICLCLSVSYTHTHTHTHPHLHTWIPTFIMLSPTFSYHPRTQEFIQVDVFEDNEDNSTIQS